MYSDYHIHSQYSFDSSEKISSILEKCISLNMKDCCITDHNDFNWPNKDEDFTLNVSGYFDELVPLKDIYKNKINLNIGVECGLMPENVHFNNKLISGNAFDFVIGSCHIVEGMDPYYPEFFIGKTDREAFEIYFNALKNAVLCFDNFDVLGHIDYIVRYSPNKNSNYSPFDYSDQIDSILKKIIETGKGIEINTSGLKSGLPFANPCPDILTRYRQLGGEIITIGSDAHQSQFIGFKFDKAGDFLAECGFNYYCIFSDRKPVFKPL